MMSLPEQIVASIQKKCKFVTWVGILNHLIFKTFVFSVLTTCLPLSQA